MTWHFYVIVYCCLLRVRCLTNKHGIFISIIFRNITLQHSEHRYGMCNIIVPLSFLIAHILLLNVAQSFRNGLEAGDPHVSEGAGKRTVGLWVSSCRSQSSVNPC